MIVKKYALLRMYCKRKNQYNKKAHSIYDLLTTSLMANTIKAFIKYPFSKILAYLRKLEIIRKTPGHIVQLAVTLDKLGVREEDIGRLVLIRNVPDEVFIPALGDSYKRLSSIRYKTTVHGSNVSRQP